MYPVQSSLIPITVALTRYIEQNGFGGLYPFWYLGTTPVKYLIGPVVPVILVGLHKILPNLSLFDLSLLLVVSSQLLLSLGWGLLAWRLSKGRKIGLFVGISSLILPWHWISAFGMGEVSAILAGGLTPWVLWSYANSMRMTIMRMDANPSTSLRTSVRIHAAPILLFALLLLTNTTAAIPAVVGILIISILNIKYQISNIKKAAIVIVIGWLLSLLWYGPGYWLTIFGAPSIGGRSAFGAIGWIVSNLRNILPIILGIIIVKFGFRPKGVFFKFASYWFLVFGTLTFLRFIADWDFWMDWTAWMGEVEIGLALLTGILVSQFLVSKKRLVNPPDRGPVTGFLPASALQPFSGKVDNPNLDTKFKKGGVRAVGGPSTGATPRIGYVLLITCYIIFGWLWACQARDFWLPRRSIEDTVEYKIADWFSDNLTIQQFNLLRSRSEASNSTIFLSGSTAFWLNSLVDVAQVRGGRDEAAAGSGWREAAWEIREGESTDKALEAMRRLGVGYLVVHTEKSSEFYHDFKDSERFEGVEGLMKVYEEDGDVVYRIE